MICSFFSEFDFGECVRPLSTLLALSNYPHATEIVVRRNWRNRPTQTDVWLGSVSSTVPASPLSGEQPHPYSRRPSRVVGWGVVPDMASPIRVKRRRAGAPPGDEDEEAWLLTMYGSLHGAGSSPPSPPVPAIPVPGIGFEDEASDPRPHPGTRGRLARFVLGLASDWGQTCVPAARLCGAYAEPELAVSVV